MTFSFSLSIYFILIMQKSLKYCLTSKSCLLIWKSMRCHTTKVQFDKFGPPRTSCNNVFLVQKGTFHKDSKGYLSSKVLEDCVSQLEKAEIPDARLEAEYIVSSSLGIKKMEVYSHSLRISQETFADVEKKMMCRLARMPLQYILGEWDFHHITLKLRPPVFIPRPETEELVEISLKILNSIERPQILDLCCGSGAISLALLNKLKQASCIALDHSKYALDLTSENANDLCLSDRLKMVQGKITAGALPKIPNDPFDLIVSNPPYILKKDLMQLQPEIMMYEDLRALDGGIDGLDIIKPIITHSQPLLKDGGSLVIEVDPCHQYLIPEWLEQKKPSLKIEAVYKDLFGKDRFIHFVKR